MVHWEFMGVSPGNVLTFFDVTGSIKPVLFVIVRDGLRVVLLSHHLKYVANYYSLSTHDSIKDERQKPGNKIIWVPD